MVQGSEFMVRPADALDGCDADPELLRRLAFGV